MSKKTLRLILGDQLNASHSWYRNKSDDCVYLIAEMYQETSYVKHHIQKLVAFFAAMEGFATALGKAGHQVLHLSLDETADDKDLPALIKRLCDERAIDRFEYQRPDEYRLQQQLASLELPGVQITIFETEHFVLPFSEIKEYFRAGKATRMESFYRKMRQRFNIMMDGDEPLGGKWNYDEDNRNKLKKSDLAEIPEPLIFENPTDDILKRLEHHKVDHFGNIGSTLLWPVTRKQALQLLDYFCEHGLPRFGQFQDAMTANSEHSWSLYHSRISFALNCKLISPMQVIQRAIEQYQDNKERVNLAQIEGFVRQILGWREFVRGIYWINMPDYQTMNSLNAERDLPEFFWTGQTRMRCMKQSLGQSLDYAYAHHIQRLMVTGNFCLLTGIDPAQVDAWYLGVYIDAIEWVEMPNTRGMCQFADGGLLASKPYAASGAYINRMSDYCSDCDYSVKQKVGDDACPFNSLYWHFMNRHREKFGNNPRIGMVYRNLDKMEESLKQRTLQHAETILADLNKL